MKYCILLLFSLVILSSCTSSREFFEMGNYYDASLKSIKKLNRRQSLKQEKILADSYLKTIEAIGSDIQMITGTPTFNRWHLLEQEYQKINNLNDAINSSHVRLNIDRQLLTDLQRQAAEVIVGTDEGDSREYKSFLITYRSEKEKYFEFLGRPKVKPEMHVAYRETNDSDSSYRYFQPDIFNSLNRMRLKLNAGDDNNAQQLIKVTFEGCRKDSSVITQTSFGSANVSTSNIGIPNSVNNAPPEATFGRNYQPGSDFLFRYTITIKCSATVSISDNKTNSIPFKRRFEGLDAWVSQWYKYRSNFNSSLAALSPQGVQWRYKSGSQGLNEYDYLEKRSYYTDLYERSNQNLTKKMISDLCSFYDYYLSEY